MAGSTKNRKIAVVGMGYVGLSVAHAFAQNEPVLGFDISESRIADLRNGYDKNNELTSDELSNPNLIYTTDVNRLKECNFIIITVLTPIDKDHRPNLEILLKATEMVGAQIKKGDIVVFESTIFPGGTEEQCIPVLEQMSGLTCNKDFGVGYSPERINPGDKVHTMKEVVKIVSGSDKETLDAVIAAYQTIVKKLHPVSRIQVAEAAKVVENTQRDINIAFMNELAELLHTLDISTEEVLQAAGTKWNFMHFKPGLVGGHCIGTNTYYLTERAQQKGFYPDLLLTGRKVNESMPGFIASNIVKQLIKANVPVKGAKVGLLGLTYKSDSPDLHDTKVAQVMRELRTYDVDVYLYDSIADENDVAKVFDGMTMTPADEFVDMDALVIANAHHADNQEEIRKMVKKDGVVIDLYHHFEPSVDEETAIKLWRL